MLLKGLSLCLALVSVGMAANPPSVLNNTDHVVVDVMYGLDVLGIGYTSSAGPSATGPLAVNQTCPSGSNSLPVTFSTTPSGSGGTLKTSSPWPLLSGVYVLSFSDGETVHAAFTYQSVAVSWSPALSGSPGATANVTNAYCFSSLGPGFVAAPTIIANATHASQPEYEANGTAVVAPAVGYQLINQSSAQYSLAGYEQPNYTALEAGGIAYSMAFCGMPTASDYPAVAFVTVLPTAIPSGPIPPYTGNGAAQCAYAQGIEFSLLSTCFVGACSWTPISGGGSMDSSTPSATTEAMSATLVALKSNHPAWTWGDVKSVLRTTASNWTTGYAAYNSSGPAFGYGNINYSSANTYKGTIYLQPPGMRLDSRGDYELVTLYPFMSTRRAGEVLYVYSSPPTFPSPGANNEYSYAQISALASTYGGALAYASSGASGEQTYTYYPAMNATVYFVAFTVDSMSNLTAAHYSRAEVFSTQSAKLTVSTACLRQ
jgi:hypothetical protein